MCACIFICIYTCICTSLEKRISIDRDCKIRSLRRKTLQIWAYCTPGIYVPGKNKQKQTKNDKETQQSLQPEGKPDIALRNLQ